MMLAEMAQHIGGPTVTPVDELAAWLREQTWSSFAQSLASYHARTGKLTDKQIAAATSMRNKVETRERSGPITSDHEVEERTFYLVDGTFYRIQKSRHGRLYAKEFDPSTASWFYVGKEPWSLFSDENKLAIEDAAAFGHRFGSCIVCGRELTDPASVAAGIGPVCAKRF